MLEELGVKITTMFKLTTVGNRMWMRLNTDHYTLSIHTEIQNKNSNLQTLIRMAHYLRHHLLITFMLTSIVNKLNIDCTEPKQHKNSIVNTGPNVSDSVE